MAASIILTNARIFTGLSDNIDTDKDTLLVKEGKIDYVGTKDDPAIEQARNSGAQEQNVNGNLVSPSFVDAHMHILLFGSALQAIHIDDCKNLQDIQDTIRAGAKARPDAERLFVQGWMHSMTDSKALASDLDDIDPRPIFIYAKDLHSAWCNTAALKDLNVGDMPNPEGGEIMRDENGVATGLLSEAAAITIVWPHIAKVTSKEDKLSQIKAAISTYHQAGYTGMIEMATDEEVWSLLVELHESQSLPIRIAMHWLIKPSKTDAENVAQVGRAIELHKQYNIDNSPNFRITGIKVIGDGVVDACTASLLEPYSSPSTNCEPIWTYDQLLPVVRRADEAGLQCALHAIGDKTVQHAVRALGTLAEDGSNRDRRHRIEHLELTSPEDSRKLGIYGITASIQPVHADPAIFTAWPTLIGIERCKRAFAYKEFADNGAPLAIGTDAPTAPHYPLRNLYTATTRRSAREEQLTETVNEHFKLGLGQALRGASFGAARSCFADRYAGTLEAGKSADFVSLDLQWDAQDLLRGSVKETWFEGRPVYQSR